MPLAAHCARITSTIDPIRDVVRFEQPQWLVEPPPVVRGQRVLLVDEICDTGRTLMMARERLTALEAAAVHSAVLYAHSWGATTPDFIAMISDALILNPWDREIYRDGGYEIHPEYAAALAEQGVEPGPSWFIQAPVVTLAKESE